MLLGRVVSFAFGLVVISFMEIPSLFAIGLLVFMTLNIEISFSKCISLRIGGRMNLKFTYVSKILVHIPLFVMEKG